MKALLSERIKAELEHLKEKRRAPKSTVALLEEALPEVVRSEKQRAADERFLLAHGYRQKAKDMGY